MTSYWHYVLFGVLSNQEIDFIAVCKNRCVMIKGLWCIYDMISHYFIFVARIFANSYVMHDVVTTLLCFIPQLYFVCNHLIHKVNNQEVDKSAGLKIRDHLTSPDLNPKGFYKILCVKYL